MERTVGAIFVTILCVFILILLFPSMVLDGLHEIQTDTRQDSFASVSTGVGETTGDVILLESIYNDSLSSVLEMISDNTSDTPTIVSYNTVTKTLTIGGLAESSTRNIQVDYETDGLVNFPEMSGMVSSSALLVFIGILILALAGGWLAIKGRNTGVSFG